MHVISLAHFDDLELHFDFENVSKVVFCVRVIFFDSHEKHECEMTRVSPSTKASVSFEEAFALD